MLVLLRLPLDVDSTDAALRSRFGITGTLVSSQELFHVPSIKDRT